MKTKEINIIGEIDFNGIIVKVYYDPYSDDEDIKCYWGTKGSHALYDDYKPYNVNLWYSECIIPEKVKESKEVLPKFIITGRKKLGKKMINSISSYLILEYKRRNPIIETSQEIKQTKYLVRPKDFHIFDLDESNNCYRSYSTRCVTYPDGTRPNAQLHFNFKNLVENYDFIPIQDAELKKYEEKHELYCGYMMWSGRSDGHGGAKGGTMQEYLEHLEHLKQYESFKNK